MKTKKLIAVIALCTGLCGTGLNAMKLANIYPKILKIAERCPLLAASIMNSAHNCVSDKDWTEKNREEFCKHLETMIEFNKNSQLPYREIANKQPKISSKRPAATLPLALSQMFCAALFPASVPASSIAIGTSLLAGPIAVIIKEQEIDFAKTCLHAFQPCQNTDCPDYTECTSYRKWFEIVSRFNKESEL